MRLHRLIAAGALAGLASVAAQAGTVRVVVLDTAGQPVPDVVVLIDASVKGSIKPPAAPVVIEQRDLRFVPFLTVVPMGSTVRFVNRDGYDHHVRSTPSGPLGAIAPVKVFEMRLDGLDPLKKKPNAVTSAEVKVEPAGPIGLGCHLHSSMRGQLYMSDTPWFAKTDANGVATIESVPDGAATARLWHPDQLQEQALLKLQVAPTPIESQATLNFTPRRRRS